MDPNPLMEFVHKINPQKNVGNNVVTSNLMDVVNANDQSEILS